LLLKNCIENNTKHSTKKDALQYMADIIPRTFSIIYLVSTTANYIKKYDKFSQIKKSGGYNEISTKLLKTCTNY